MKLLQVKDAFQFLAWRFSLNTYEVGGGKTVVSTVVSMLGPATTTLVLVPPILVPPWLRWLRKHSDSVLRYDGAPTTRKKFVLGDHRWVVMTHGVFRKDFERIYEDLKGKDVDTIVDEAQWLKNIESKLYTYVGIFTNRPHGSLQMLTGTPTSTPMDCYAYLRLLRLPFYRSMKHFENSHVYKRDFFKKVIGWQNLEVLADRFNARRIHRSRLEVHGPSAPPLFPDTTYELSKEHMDLYEKMIDEQLLEYDDETLIDVSTATKLYHAMQAAVVNYDFYSNDPTSRSAAYDLIDQTIEETECLQQGKSKLIIWTYYKLTSASVLAYLAKLGIDAVGAYSEVNSEKNMERFMNDPACRVGVFQYQSAGAGLNPQGVCWEALFLELTRSTILMTQALGRIDREGQLHIPSQRIACASGTIQETLLAGLLQNDDTVTKVERTKKSLREVLLGRNPR